MGENPKRDVGDEITDSIVAMLEHDTGKEIFTLRVLDKDIDAHSLEVIVVFTDKNIMTGILSIFQTDDGKIGARMQGNYI